MLLDDPLHTLSVFEQVDPDVVQLVWRLYIDAMSGAEGDVQQHILAERKLRVIGVYHARVALQAKEQLLEHGVLVRRRCRRQ